MDSNNQNNNEEEQALPFNGDASNFHVDIKDTTAGGHTLVLPKDQQQAQMTAQLQNQNVNTQPFGYTAGQMNQPQSQYAAPGMGVQPNPYNGQQMVNPTAIPGASMRVTSVPPVPPKQKKEKDKGMSIAILFSICAVLVLCGVGVYFLFFTSDKKMERKIKKAENALEEQDYDKAIELYEEICEEYPDDLDYNYALFSAYYSDKQYGNFLLKFNAYRGKIEKMSSEQVNENRSKIVDLYEMALDAADSLAKKGIKARVLDMHTIKPIDKKAIIDAAKETGFIVTAEEHNIYGGLGSIVASVVSDSFPCLVKMVAIKDTFGESGKPDELLKKYHLTAKDIYNAVIK